MARNSNPIFTAKHYEKIAQILGAATKYDIFAVDAFVQSLKIDSKKFDETRFRKAVLAVESGPDICACGSKDFGTDHKRVGFVQMYCKNCGAIFATEGDH